MKYLFLEFRLIKEDILKLLIVIILIPILSTVVYLQNNLVENGWVLTDAMSLLFGSVQNYKMNWIYWIFFCFGYVILNQILWKPRLKYFEYNLLILQQNITLFWINKLIMGFVFTLIYISASFFIAICGFNIYKVNLHLGSLIFLQFLFIVVNFYLHSIIWVFLRMFISTNIANLTILTLFYVSVNIPKIYLPLYFSMIDNFTGKNMLILTFISEFLLIFVLGYLILMKGKLKDYY